MPSSKGKKETRRPKQEQDPPARQKEPQSNPQSVNNQPFRWDVRNVDFGGEYGWDKVGMKTLFQEIIPKLQQHESRTWGEVEGKDSHFVDVGECSPEAHKRLKEIKLDDLGQLFSLRIGGKKRIFGWREKSIFHVLWWDPKHQVCPSKKKHT